MAELNTVAELTTFLPSLIFTQHSDSVLTRADDIAATTDFTAIDHRTTDFTAIGHRSKIIGPFRALLPCPCWLYWQPRLSVERQDEAGDVPMDTWKPYVRPNRSLSHWHTPPTLDPT